MSKNICILSPSKNAASESFIKAHIDLLKGNKYVLYNKYPNYEYNNEPLQNLRKPNFILDKLQKLLPYFLYKKIYNAKRKIKELDHSILSFLKRNRINIILAEYGFSGADILPYVKKLNIPLIIHYHGYDAHNNLSIEPYKELYKEMFIYAKNIMSVSKSMTKSLVALGADLNKITLNPYGPNSDFYSTIPDYDNTFIAVGRFIEKKAPHITLTAFSKVLEVCKDAKLIMIGDGPLRESTMSLAVALEINDSVNFPGALNHNQVKELMKKACCFVQHSITAQNGDSEGTPVAILEAQAAGLPVVSTKHTGIMEAVIDGETGYLVNERDARSMAFYMLKLIQDKDLCKTMGKKGKMHIKENYSLETHINRIQNIIDSNQNTK
jgi:colanic acid/amylovoran biosynthesis glycosyltransferase